MIRAAFIGLVVLGCCVVGAGNVQAQYPSWGGYGPDARYRGSVPRGSYQSAAPSTYYHGNNGGYGPTYPSTHFPRGQQTYAPQNRSHSHHSHHAHRYAQPYPQLPPQYNSSYPHSGNYNPKKHTGEYPDHPWHLGHYLFHH